MSWCGGRELTDEAAAVQLDVWRRAEGASGCACGCTCTSTCASAWLLWCRSGGGGVAQRRSTSGVREWRAGRLAQERGKEV